MATPPAGSEWWRTGVIYHVYPRSFQDTTGDGIGDLPGIIQRLDHLAGAPGSLGVDAIWLSPVYPSPMADFGYDVADYTAVDPIFGTLADLDRLVWECHRRGVRLILDFVANHTSERHPWFIESRASRQSPRRDWYLWRDPAPGDGPPNNWQSAFGGPAWTFDEASGQYYLHSFLPQQPDLDWRNPAVVEAMQGIARWWLSRGIDGFRIDAASRLLKDPSFADNPPRGNADGGSNHHLHPDLPGALQAIRSVVEEFPGCVAIGEVYAPPRAMAGLYGRNGEGLHLAFNFGLIRGIDSGPYEPWDAGRIAAVLRETEEHLPPGAQACYQLSNLDVSRFISRNNPDGLGHLRARAAALLLLGLRGTPCIYYGDEIGMADVPVPPAQEQDAAGRDPERAPMPWDGSAGRGFTSGTPWLPFGPPSPNVAAQRAVPASLLNLYRAAIALRRREPSLQLGAFTIIEQRPDCLLFQRAAPGARPVFVALNTGAEVARLALPPANPGIVLASDSGCITGAPDSPGILLPPLAAAWLA